MLFNDSIPEDDLIGFLDACKKLLDYLAPPKKEYIRANQVPSMTKELNKEIMTISRLRNKFLRFRSEENKKAYNEQHNRCITPVRNAKKSHYSNLDIKGFNDNEPFWKIVKPLFTEKVSANENITLADNNNITSSDVEIAEKLYTFLAM